MKTRHFAFVAALAGSTAMLLGSQVLAYPNGQFWEMPASGQAGVNRAGAGGIWYTGSSQDFGLKCSSCHIDGAGLINVTITPSPAWEDVGGEPGYLPNTPYTITINLTGEHLGAASGGGDNDGVNVAFEDASGATAGSHMTDSGVGSASCPATYPVSAPTGTTYTYGDCHAITFVHKPAPSNSTWTFTWTSPTAGTGDVTMFYSAVDGDTGEESSLGDDVVDGTLVLREGS